MNNNEKIEIYEKELVEYFFLELTRLGFVVKVIEAQIISNIMFDWLDSKGILEDITEEEN